MQAGEVIEARFEIEALAGAGAMGQVFRARDRESGATVAIKVLIAGAADPLRFQRESAILKTLRHEGVVSYLGHGIASSGLPYLAMEWLEGESLSERLARGALAPGDAVALGLRLAEALGEAHHAGIVHRDVKPSNVLLVGGSIARAKLLDFGIARFGDRRELTLTGAVLGTPAYMAPEQARGEPDVDARADVFALGCTLFRCISGRTPFLADDMLSMLLKIVLETAPRLGAVCEGVPPELEELIARMLSNPRELRPADGAAVAAALRALETKCDGAVVALRAGAPLLELTTSERRVMCLVLARSESSGREEATMAPAELSARERRARESVEASDGRVDVLADGSILAVFASSSVATDLAKQAARAALTLRAALEDARIGVVSGRGVIDERAPLDALVERAAHLVARGVPGKIGIDDVTAGLLDVQFELEGDDAGLYLAAERDDLEPVRTLLGTPTTTVGRAREQGLLGATLEECVGESVARAILVTGAPGVGKSRLRDDFVRFTRGAHPEAEVWLAGGDPMSRGSTFGHLGRAMAGAFGVRSGEPLGTRQRRVRARVARNIAGAAADRVAEFLGEMLGVPFPDEESVELRAARREPLLMGDQLRRAWCELIVAECRARPIVLVLEDMQWGDLSTVEFVDAALRAAKDLPLLVLALARPEVEDVFPRMWTERAALEMRLGGLSRKAGLELCREVLGTDVAPDALATLLARADGNAFHLEELLRSFSEDGGARPPETVIAMMQSRLDRLAPSARRVLRAASLYGEAFPAEGLPALLGGEASSGPLSRELAELERQELVLRADATRGSGARYAFRQGLVRDAAYAMLTEEDRVLGHRLAGEWLERGDEHDAMVLAGHFERGGDGPRAGRWFRRAAEQALEGSDLEGVLARAERGLACAVEPEVLGSLHLLQALALRWRGENARAERASLLALAALPRRAAMWYRAAGELANIAGVLGRADQVNELAEDLRARSTEPAIETARLIACAHAASAVLTSGDYELAGSLLDELDAAESAWLDPAIAARASWARARRAGIRGDKAEYLQHVRASLESFRAIGNVRSTANQLVAVGAGYVELGAAVEAERVLRDAHVEATRLGLHSVSASALNNLGTALLLQGRLDEARTAERAGLEAFRAQGNDRLEGSSRSCLAQIELAAGELAAAEEEARAATELLEAFPPSRAAPFAVLAQILLARGDTGGAADASRAATAILEALGDIDDGESLVRLMRAETLHASGDVAAAREAMRVASARLLERAARIRDEVLRRAFLAGVPENARTLELASAWGDAPRAEA